jgi:ATP-dependent helicase/nuclease subunit A
VTQPQPAYLIDGEHVGPAAFYRAACDPRRPVVIEACAGAGKTWMLVSRILRALLEGAEPREILAITFTRKAVGEVRGRLDEWLAGFSSARCTHDRRVEELMQRGLDAAEAEAAAPRLGALHDEMLRDGRRVEIRTFHGWFQQLLRSAPWALLAEIGLGGAPELIEDFADHRREVMRRFHRAVRADAVLVGHRDALLDRRGRSTVERWLDAVIDNRIEIELSIEAGTLATSVETAARWEPQWAGLAAPEDRWMQPAATAMLQQLATELGAAGRPKRARDAAGELEAALQLGDATARHAAIVKAVFTQAGEVRAHLDASSLAGVVDLAQAIAAARLQADAADDHHRMAQLAEVLVRTWRDYKREAGLIDHSDLERGALALMRDATLSAWMHERLDLRVRHLLIDEFQDTNPLQWQAVRAWLEGYAGAGGGASGLRPPGVFIVGDPKQSIYRFRRAEPRVFTAAGEFVVEALGGQRLACDHTRRNTPAVLAGMNQVFEPLAGGQRYAGFRVHTTDVDADAPLLGLTRAHLGCVPRRGADADAPAPRRRPAAGDDPPDVLFRDSLVVPRDRAEEHRRLVEARRVAAAIERLLHPPDGTPGLPPNQVLVLCRRRDPLASVAQALRERRIPHAPAEALPLIESIEVRDLLAVLDVLASPGQDLSLAQALRSPLFDVDDDGLQQVAAAVLRGDAPTWWAALMALADAPPALARAQRLLASWQREASRLPPHDLLDRIVEEGDLMERLAACVPAAYWPLAQASVQALLAVSLRLDGARYATPYRFVRALRRRAIETPPPARPDAVQLLTIHGAKGLEADAVFVVDSKPQAARADGPGVLVDWPVDDAAPRCCAFVSAASRTPPSLADLRRRDDEARQREELNGLYVAMTRARRLLVFSATEPYHAGPESWWQLVEPMLTGWPGLAPAAGSVPPAQPSTPASQPSAAVAQPSTPASQPSAAAAQPSAQPLPQAAVPGDASGVTIETVPEWQPRASAAAGFAAPPPDPPDGDVDRDGLPDTDPLRRLGRAVHRALEWLTGSGLQPGQSPTPSALSDAAVAAAAEHGLVGAEGAAVETVVARLLAREELRRFFDPRGLQWAGNEVSVGWHGAVLRIDRLVQFKSIGDRPGEWWVLDYKLDAAPQRQPHHLEQLRRYRDAVRALQPEASVRCAFVTAAGELVEPAD